MVVIRDTTLCELASLEATLVEESWLAVEPSLVVIVGAKIL